MYTRSANEVGGDLVDYVPIDAAQTAVVLADVAGKGLSAALLTAKLQATLRALVGECGSLARLGECVNQIMYRDGVRGRFATLVWLGLNTADGGVRVLNAGHMPPLVVSPTGVEPLPRGSMALGMVPAAAFTEQAVRLDAGDVIVAYSDGVTEMMNASREFFGEQRLRDLLAAQRGRDAAVIGQTVVEAVSTFAAGTPAHDDVSLVVARRLPS
jgi:sigma-B regulation protein RsbU (phosphoserine phosphatase)